VLAEKRKEHHKEQLILGAWSAFLLSGTGQTFGEYLEAIGLGDKPTEDGTTAVDAIAKAQKILEMARERI